MYTTRKHYTDNQLKRYQIADVLTDIRCGYRDGHELYAMKCEREAVSLAGPTRKDIYGYFTAK